MSAKPTVGSNVHFWSSVLHGGVQDEKQPCAAIIIFVVEDEGAIKDKVRILAWDHNGTPSVHEIILHDGEAKDKQGHGTEKSYATWPVVSEGGSKESGGKVATPVHTPLPTPTPTPTPKPTPPPPPPHTPVSSSIKT